MEEQDDEIKINLEELEELQSTSNKKDVEWREEHEKILIEWADKAMCYRWLHSRSYAIYARKYAWYTIPVIIISTITIVIMIVIFTIVPTILDKTWNFVGIMVRMNVSVPESETLSKYVPLYVTLYVDPMLKIRSARTTKSYDTLSCP